MNVDKSNMLKAIEDFAHQCKTAFELVKGVSVLGKIDKIVVCGMGGSAVGGDLLKICLKDSKIPVFVIKEYDIPNFIDDKTLLFAVSYSGNTEETLSAFSQAKKKNAKIVAITSNGDLATFSQKVIKVPAGLQPRAALGYLFFPMVGVLSNSNLIEIKEKDIEEMLSMLSKTDDFKQEAQKLAKKIHGKIPLIYSSQTLYPVAYRWKTQLNENSKIPAFSHSFPEMNHNEIVGYQGMDKGKFISILIRDNEDNERIKKRMDIIKEMIKSRVDVEEVITKGNSLLSRMFYAIYLGDFTSYYLALENNVDPTPVVVIENLKKRLS